MPKLAALTKALAGSKIPQIKIAKAPNDRIGMGAVPDQAPQMDKAKALLAGVPMSIRGKKPRLGSL